MLISIITINYNDLNGLKKTMTSVLEQTYKNIEYIIIDGGSNDGSVAYIKKKAPQLSYWVSEPDNGIYYAMNKGVEKSSGDYLLFMNSGDWLVDALVIEKFVNFKPIEDIVYGEPLVRDGDGWRRKTMPKKLNIGVVLTHTLGHQAEFYRSKVFRDNYRYDTSYLVISDWILTNNAIIFNNCTTKYIDLVVCYFEDAGISSDFNLRHEERKRYFKNTFDSSFLKLLKDYRKLYNEHNTIKNSSLVLVALWILRKKGQLLNILKSNNE